MYLKQKEIEVKELLAKYKFLTSSQFVHLGLYKNKGDVSKLLKAMSEKKKASIGVIKFPTDPTIGKLEYIYYLTKYGEKILLEDLDYPQEKIKSITKSKPTSTKDYFHRKSTIDFNIQLTQWLDSNDGEVKFLNYYFDKEGSNRNMKKKLKGINRLFLEDGRSFIPDITTKFEISGKEYLFLFEQHNGNDTKRLLEQLYIHLLAISQGAASKRYGFERSNRVAIVCESEGVKKSIIKRLQEIDAFSKFYNFFIFKTNRELEKDFFNNWTLINEEAVNLIQKSNIVKNISSQR